MPFSWALPLPLTPTLTPNQVPFSWARGVALGMVLLGGGFYSFHVHLEKGRGGRAGGGAGPGASRAAPAGGDA